MYTIRAEAYGAFFDGVTDDTDALKRAISAAGAVYNGVLELPAGIAIISGTLDLRGQYITIRGAGYAKTKLLARGALTIMLDAGDGWDDQEGTSDVIYSPLVLDGFTIDGNNSIVAPVGTAETGVRISHRHNSVFSNLVVQNCATGVLERDTWLSRRYNCRSESCGVGWHLLGSNHASIFEGCSFNGASHTHLLIDSQGTAIDGNQALTFQTCDVEFSRAGSTARGVVIAEGALARFEGCYLGENVTGPILTNSGHTQIEGGVIYFGNQPASKGITCLEGRVVVNGSGLYGNDTAGAASFGTLVAGNAVSDKNRGRVKFTSVRSQFPIASENAIEGDPLDYGPAAHVFAPRLGRMYQPFFFNATGTSSLGTDTAANSLTVACTSSSATNPVIGMSAPLTGTDWRRGEPFYLVVVYEATREVVVRLSAGAGGTLPLAPLAVLPATATAKTYVRVDIDATDEAVSVIELFVQLAPDADGAGQSLTLHELFLADSSVVGHHAQSSSASSAGAVANLLKC